MTRVPCLSVIGLAMAGLLLSGDLAVAQPAPDRVRSIRRLGTAARMTPPVRQVIAFECGRAREYYRRAVEMRPEPDRRRLVAAEIMRAVYFETLRRVERRNYDVFSGRLRLARPVQAAIAIRQWFWPQ